MLPCTSTAFMERLSLVNTPNCERRVIDKRQLLQLMTASYFDKSPMLFTETGWTEFNHARKVINKDGNLKDSRGNVIDKGGNLNGLPILRVSSHSMKSIHLVDYPEKFYLKRNKDGMNIVRKRSVSFNLVALDSLDLIKETLETLEATDIECVDNFFVPCDISSPTMSMVTATIKGFNEDESYKVYYVMMPKRKVRSACYFRYGIYEETVLKF